MDGVYDEKSSFELTDTIIVPSMVLSFKFPRRYPITRFPLENRRSAAALDGIAVLYLMNNALTALS